MFARKIVKASTSQAEDVTFLNEIRVIDKIRKFDRVNIVTFLKHGRLDPHQYYIDMELCVLNLEEYMKQNLRSEFGVHHFFNPSYSGELDFLSLWSITDQIATALEFLHAEGEFHRDLKPRNGTPQSLGGLTGLQFFYLLETRAGNSQTLD